MRADGTVPSHVDPRSEPFDAGGVKRRARCVGGGRLADERPGPAPWRIPRP